MLGSKGPPIGNGLLSRDRRRHVTPKGQVVISICIDPNISETAGGAI